jgi:hypothetical protein
MLQRKYEMAELVLHWVTFSLNYRPSPGTIGIQWLLRPSRISISLLQNRFLFFPIPALFSNNRAQTQSSLSFRHLLIMCNYKGSSFSLLLLWLSWKHAKHLLICVGGLILSIIFSVWLKLFSKTGLGWSKDYFHYLGVQKSTGLNWSRECQDWLNPKLVTYLLSNWAQQPAVSDCNRRKFFWLLTSLLDVVTVGAARFRIGRCHSHAV